MDTLTSAEVADLLHLTVKRVQALARTGSLPAVRVGRRWLFPRRAIEALLDAKDDPRTGPVDLSARNRLAGRVTALTCDGVMAEVRLAIGDQELVAIITRASAERLGLAAGDGAYAVIKSTEVMIGKAP